MTDFTGTVDAWKQADVEAIHPLRAVDEEAYWDSGASQAAEAGLFVPEGGTVVDFGCGDGRLTIPLAELGFKVIAVDASPTMLERLQEQIEKHEYGSELNIEMICSDGLDLLRTHIKPRSVDAVVARAVLIHHDHRSVERLVIALARLIKRKGHFIADWPLGPHHVRRDWIDVTTWRRTHRARVAQTAELILVEDGTPSVWQCR